MAVITNFEKLPSFHNPVLTIGSFDGVHHGHKAILQQVVKEAQKVNGDSILITFYPHPRKIIHPERPLGLLVSQEQKMQIITGLGIDYIVVVPFSREFSLMSAETYIDQFLWDNFHPKTIVLGYDHHFGHDRKGNINLLREKLGHKVHISEIPAQLIKDAAVSSTKIREALKTGKIEAANAMLERPFSFDGAVVQGDKIGRTLGFPTANLQLKSSDLLCPCYGVYIVRVQLHEAQHYGLMSIGVRPTINDEKELRFEVYILDFDADVYGETLGIEFLHYLRPELRCASLDELVQLMRQDERKARAWLHDLNPYPSA